MSFDVAIVILMIGLVVAIKIGTWFSNGCMSQRDYDRRARVDLLFEQAKREHEGKPHE